MQMEQHLTSMKEINPKSNKPGEITAAKAQSAGSSPKAHQTN